MANGTLYIVSAPSGAGKSSLISALLKQQSDLPMQVSVSHTTRAPRPGEKNGVHYHFVNKAEFEQLIEQHAFFEHAQVFDNYYGTSQTVIKETLAQGIDVFLDIDWQGARQVKKMMPEALGIYILPPSQAELKSRLTSRGQDSDDVINKRMAKAQAEMSHYNEYDYLIINDDFDDALEQFSSIISSNRLLQPMQNEKYADMLKQLLAS